MSPESTLAIPRAKYGLITAIAAVASVAVGAAVAWGLGGGPGAVRVVAMAMGAGVMLSLIPAVASIAPEFWGVAVLGCGVGRALLTLAIAYGALQGAAGVSGELASRPVMVGAAAGTVLMLVVETVASVRVLAAIERAKDERKKAGLGRSPVPMEHV